MIIFPAIDMLGGKPVRLYQGDYAQSEVVASDIVEQAKQFERDGATWLHMVDLDGAKAGRPENFDYVKKVKKATNLNIQIGGGIRNLETLEALFDAGIDRAILGTAAVKDRDFLVAAIEKYGAKIAVGIDVLNGEVKVSGWLESTQRYLDEFAQEMADIGVQTLIVTDIAKDGAMSGTNLEMMKKLSDTLSLQLIASGGVSALDDLKALSDFDIYGAIIGKALYNGAIDLPQAIAASK
ncbi:1-(5-phosphoribosyl)-5-[(5-phosphoribosylamino)methylideneamino]imidazole-4-carboxamide isomerase [Aerococcaceae bacterium DSM 111022]|nr:1-(5-phosphoribosyl)-5-[(5-phosphoribosylamino)methylideneamino]imidazole-4-carboxamide isomerase [Aerococcaceae bacterium DSM 111022]